MSVGLLFIVYVERSTDAAANEKAREERERDASCTAMHTLHLMKVMGEATIEDASGGAGKIKKGKREAERTRRPHRRWCTS